MAPSGSTVPDRLAASELTSDAVDSVTVGADGGWTVVVVVPEPEPAGLLSEGLDGLPADGLEFEGDEFEGDEFEGDEPDGDELDELDGDEFDGDELGAEVAGLEGELAPVPLEGALDPGVDPEGSEVDELAAIVELPGTELDGGVELPGTELEGAGGAELLVGGLDVPGTWPPVEPVVPVPVSPVGGREKARGSPAAWLAACLTPPPEGRRATSSEGL